MEADGHARRLRLRHGQRGRSLRSIDAIWDACAQAEIPLESVNSEYDTPQFEFTLRYSDALRAADDGFLFKVLAREVAHRMGLLLTFMGKPLSDRGGSGLHVNFSFRNRRRRQRHQ